MHGRALLPLARGATQWCSEFVGEYCWERDYPMADVRTAMRGGRLFNRIQDPELKQPGRHGRAPGAGLESLR